MSAEHANPEPGGPCPKCDGDGGYLSDMACMAEWIECKACDGTGEHWPDAVPTQAPCANSA